MNCRISYHKFKKCKNLEMQIKEDLQNQIGEILIMGLEDSKKVKSEAANKENELRSKLSTTISDSDRLPYLKDLANLNYQNGDYISCLVNSSAFIEILLRQKLTEYLDYEHTRGSLYALIKIATDKNLIGHQTYALLTEFRNIRNRAFHDGFIPSKKQANLFVEILDILKQELNRN